MASSKTRKPFQLSMHTQRKKLLFLTCKRRYNSDVSCFQGSTFASNAQRRRPLSVFQNGGYDQAGKQKTL